MKGFGGAAVEALGLAAEALAIVGANLLSGAAMEALGLAAEALAIVGAHRLSGAAIEALGLSAAQAKGSVGPSLFPQCMTKPGCTTNNLAYMFLAFFSL